MEQSKPVINQKEYLKRYLMKDKDKKSKKKKKQAKVSSSTHLKRSVIIDDDINISEIPRVVDDEFTLDHLGDEAPQIVGIVDERPEEVKLAERYESGKWRPMGAEEGNLKVTRDGKQPDDDDLWGVRSSRGGPTKNSESVDANLTPPHRTKKNRTDEKSKNNQSNRWAGAEEKSDSDLEVPRPHARRVDSERRDRKIDRNKSNRAGRSDESDSEMRTRKKRDNVDRVRESKSSRRDHRSSSPGHSSKHDWDMDAAPPRKIRPGTDNIRKRGRSDSDASPSRRIEPDLDSDLSPPRRRKGSSDSGLSPPRRRKGGKDPHVSPSKGRMGGGGSDLSPPRRRKGDSDSDLSPPRRRKGGGDADLSPHRRRKGGRDPDPSTARRRKGGGDSDLSPPRRRKGGRDPDLSPPRRSKGGSDSDLSPPRKRKGGRDMDLSPPRRRKGEDDSDLSPPRRRKGGDDSVLSPSRRKAVRHESDSSPPRHKRSDHGNAPNEKLKSDKMQDGKKAGLQDAKSLKDELRILKEKEDEMFRQMDPELLGRSTQAVVRDRRTGLKRDFEKEREIERQKAAKDAVRQKKYEKWGKGLKQVQEQEERVADMMHEMSKPLARYADDDDLERALKAQEREGDPMLEYIRRHQKESHSIDLTVGGTRKKYQGSYLPNRFNIPPGHRWDGVDRSNGYEQKWFAAKNAKKATAEEAWKWSSADM